MATSSDKPIPAEPLTVPAFRTSVSAGTRYLKRANSVKAANTDDRSDLLSSIKAALKGHHHERNPSVHSTLSPSSADLVSAEEELSWNDDTVVRSIGGRILSKWCFEREGQDIQYACISSLHIPGVQRSGKPGESSRTKSEPDANPVHSGEESFSPFFRKSQDKVVEPSKLSRAVFIFFRSFGKIILLTGIEYTFSLPFLVRKAWPLNPSGVLMQRVFDQSELQTGATADPDDFELPTLFSLINPFEEPRAVGVLEKIRGGYDKRGPAITNLLPGPDQTINFLPASERVLWVSSRSSFTKVDIMVTVNEDRKKLSFWHYAFEPIKPVPSKRAMSKKQGGVVGPSTQSAAAHEKASKGDRIREPSPEGFEDTQPADPNEAQLFGMSVVPPSLSNTATTASIATGSSAPAWSTSSRRNSFTRNDLTSTMDRMVLGRSSDVGLTDTQTQDSTQPVIWVAKLHDWDIAEGEETPWEKLTFGLYDYRKEDCMRSLMSVCSPFQKIVHIFKIKITKAEVLEMEYNTSMPALAATPILSLRPLVLDLLVLTPDHRLIISTYHGKEIPVELRHSDAIFNAETSLIASDEDLSMTSLVDCRKIVALRDPILSNVTVVFEDGSRARINVNLMPQDELTSDVLTHLSGWMDFNNFFKIHVTFLENWLNKDRTCVPEAQFECLTQVLLDYLDCLSAEDVIASSSEDPWHQVLRGPSGMRLKDDTALAGLRLPVSEPKLPPDFEVPSSKRKHREVVLTLHILGEDMRLFVPKHIYLPRLARLIIRIASPIWPGWAEHWKRLIPCASDSWNVNHIRKRSYNDDILWIRDVSASLFHRLRTQEAGGELKRALDLTSNLFSYFHRGRFFHMTQAITELYNALCDSKSKDPRKRSEETVLKLVQMEYSSDFLNLLPIAIAIPLREAARTCSLAPPAKWMVSAYEFVGRNDLTEGYLATSDILFNDGYRSMKDHLNQKLPRKTYRALFEEAHKAVCHGDEMVYGVELDLADFTDIRFGQDRRLEEVARMLRSSVVTTVRMQERPELSEHELSREQQMLVNKTAERTFSLPLGRAMFTFGSVPSVKKEICTIPKIELGVRITPHNVLIAPDPAKIPPDAMPWAEFHNGVAAALRIAPSSGVVESSWIAFNKPNDLTAAHAGFLYGLGLTGHLKEMLSWHTFGYLTPKHDLTSIGVLLGLSAANVGTGNRQVTKLLAVHTPALLPVSGVDLNVPWLTQASGLVGIGLLYMGTKNRRMAEVALLQLPRKDFTALDLTNEYREAYVLAAAFSFGMIMLGRGTVTSPADVSILSRLRVLIHGEGPTPTGHVKEDDSFDVNLTSPAATLALGLMFLRTNSQEVADILTIPDTVLSLNNIQPSFLLVRTFCRALIMWDSIKATKEWVHAQIPGSILKAFEDKFRQKTDDSLQLAYYYIVAGCCFALGLKYAGTAREEAYARIAEYHDYFVLSSNNNAPSFDVKIKRVAVRDGINLASLSLNMVMAGTGEINCLRRLRYAHGANIQGHLLYGANVATHMSLGLLFLGGGRYTLGSSDAAIACMVAAFYPRFPIVSSDNRCYLPAMRHLWVLAVEPRCLIARDIDTKEVIYLPTKIRYKEGNGVAIAQMISPTLIPSLDRLLSIKVDTPRYWPFYLDIAGTPAHRQTLIRNQTLFVKRRTMFLSYLEDPKGSRSLFVRSGMSTGEAASLDHPQLSDGSIHPASDLHQFITSHSNDIAFTAFADRLCRGDGMTDAEKILNSFCHAALLDCIIQDKPQILSSYLMLYRTRTMSPRSRYFQLEQQDLARVAEFYLRTFDRQFSGRSEQISRAALLRESSVVSAVNAVGERLRDLSKTPGLQRAIEAHALGQRDTDDLRNSEDYPDLSYHIAWYLSRHTVPPSAYLPFIRERATVIRNTLIAGTSEEERDDEVLSQSVKLIVFQSIGTIVPQSTDWSIESFEHFQKIWANNK